MVLREKHPLSFPGAPVGRAGKRYCKSDRSSPIQDALTDMMTSVGWRKPEPARDHAADLPTQNFVVHPPTIEDQMLTDRLGDFGLTEEDPTACAAAPQACSGCGRASRQLELSKDKDCFVCKCGVVCERVFTAQHREKACAEADDKTTHADKPQDVVKDRFDQRSLNADDRRKERERVAKTSGFLDKRSREKLGLGYVQESLQRKVAQANRRRELLSPKEQIKEGRIMEELDLLFDKLGSMSREVKRHFRFSTSVAWQVACAHHKACAVDRLCKLDISSKAAPVIAEGMLAVLLETLLHSEEAIVPEASRSHIASLNSRFQALTTGSGVGAAQRTVRLICKQLLAHGHSSRVLPPCVESERPLDALPDAPLAPENDATRLKDNLLQVFGILSAPLAVYKGALQVIQTPEFKAAAKEVGLPSKPLAYVLLEASSRAHGEAPGASGRLLATLGLTAAAAEAAVRALQAHLAPAAFQAPIDDELF
jgi:hypothetical protein